MASWYNLDKDADHKDRAVHNINYISGFMINTNHYLNKPWAGLQANHRDENQLSREDRFPDFQSHTVTLTAITNQEKSQETVLYHFLHPNNSMTPNHTLTESTLNTVCDVLTYPNVCKLLSNYYLDLSSLLTSSHHLRHIPRIMIFKWPCVPTYKHLLHILRIVTFKRPCVSVYSHIFVLSAA